MLNLYSLLEPIRARPGMYLGEPSLSCLRAFLNGYSSALFDHGIPVEQVGIWRPLSRELPNFHTFVARKLKNGYSAEGYAEHILRHVSGDERAALELLWVLLDEYRGLEAALDAQVLPKEE